MDYDLLEHLHINTRRLDIVKSIQIDFPKAMRQMERNIDAMSPKEFVTAIQNRVDEFDLILKQMNVMRKEIKDLSKNINAGSINPPINHNTK